MNSNGKITKRDVDALKPGTRDVFLWEAGDGAIKGFAVKVTPKGKKTFIFQYRLGGRGSPTKRIQIGEQGMLVADARDKADKIRQGIRDGVPPSTTRARDKAKLICGLIVAYLANLRERELRSVDEVERILNKHVLPVWGARTITGITIDDVEDLVDDAKRGAPVHANRILAWVKGMFTFAVKKRMLRVSPAYAVDPPTPENSRDRVLADGELIAIWKASTKITGAFDAATRLLLLSGQRESEVGEMPKVEIDFGRRLWDIPEDRAKNRQAHLVHLSDLAIDAIKSAPVLSKKYTFSTDGKTHIQGWNKWKERLDVELTRPAEDWVSSESAGHTLQVSLTSSVSSRGEDVRMLAKGHKPFTARDKGRTFGIRHDQRWGFARIRKVISPTEAQVIVLSSFASTGPSSEWVMGMDAWVFHDFRRVMATRLNEMGFQENVVDRILNHRNKNAKARTIVKKIYNRAEYLPERKAALEAWGRYIEALVIGTVAPSNVVPITEKLA